MVYVCVLKKSYLALTFAVCVGRKVAIQGEACAVPTSYRRENVLCCAMLKTAGRDRHSWRRFGGGAVALLVLPLLGGRRRAAIQRRRARAAVGVVADALAAGQRACCRAGARGGAGIARGAVVRAAPRAAARAGRRRRGCRCRRAARRRLGCRVRRCGSAAAVGIAAAVSRQRRPGRRGGRLGRAVAIGRVLAAATAAAAAATARGAAARLAFGRAAAASAAAASASASVAVRGALERRRLDLFSGHLAPRPVVAAAALQADGDLCWWWEAAKGWRRGGESKENQAM